MEPAYRFHKSGKWVLEWFGIEESYLFLKIYKKADQGEWKWIDLFEDGPFDDVLAYQIWTAYDKMNPKQILAQHEQLIDSLRMEQKL